MVLPLIASVFGLGIFGWLGFQVASFTVYWVSAGTGLIILALSMKYFLENNPAPVTNDDSLNNVLYLMFSGVAGFIGFKLVQAVFAVAGVSLAIVAAFLIVGSYFFGAATVASVVASIIGFVIEIVDQVLEGGS